MKTPKLAARLLELFVLVFAAVLFSGCAGPMARTSKYMAVVSKPLTSPPPGKSLVCIQRPRAYTGYGLYTAVWDDTHFVADLGNGHSVAYVCDPGEHYFLNLSVEETGCVDAQLLPDQTYDLWIQGGYGFWVASFKLRPLHQDAKTRQRVAKWTRKNRWVEPAPAAKAYEQANQERIHKLVEEFVSGRRHKKLQHLAADDHR